MVTTYRVFGLKLKMKSHLIDHGGGVLLGGNTRSMHKRVFKFPCPFPAGDGPELDRRPMGTRTATGSGAGLIDAGGPGSTGSGAGSARNTGSTGFGYAGGSARRGAADQLECSAPHTAGTSGSSTNNTINSSSCSGSGSGGASGATGSTSNELPASQLSMVQVQEWPVLVGSHSAGGRGDGAGGFCGGGRVSCR